MHIVLTLLQPVQGAHCQTHSTRPWATQAHNRLSYIHYKHTNVLTEVLTFLLVDVVQLVLSTILAVLTPPTYLIIRKKKLIIIIIIITAKIRESQKLPNAMK